MRKSLSLGFGIMFLCSIVLVGSFSAATRTRAASDDNFARTPILGFDAVQGDVNLTMNRDTVVNQVASGEANVVLAKYTFTNRGSSNIKVSSPRFYALANGPFSLGGNVANMRLSDYANIQRAGYIVGNTVEFPGWMTIPGNGSLTIYVLGDILSGASVKALEFEPDFSSPDFVINSADAMGNDISLAPFNLTGYPITLQFNGQNYMANTDTASNVDYARHYYSVVGTLTAPYIPEGAIIRNQAGIDVYIVKYNNGKRFMRLILSPSVFKSYGHLKWENILVINDVVERSYSISYCVYVAGDSTIWRLEPVEDSGVRRRFFPRSNANWIDYDPDGIYQINTTDRDSYATGADITN
jgi:hypothetical protein